MKMKGIILAGGSGTRLKPLTISISKQILPVYDKPMIYYPLSMLMLAGIREILIISTPRDLPMIEHLLGDGSQLGLTLKYKVQPKPEGLPQAYTLAKNFLKGAPSCMVLGDNIFYGSGLSGMLQECAKLKKGGIVAAYRVKDPERYGVVEFDAKDRVLSIEEKPKTPKSSYALTGMYFFDGDAPKIAAKLRPSARGELEITDMMKVYLARDALQVRRMARGIAWLDTGTPEALLDAAQFIKVVEDRQGLKISCIEEIAYSMKFINRSALRKLADQYPKHPYGAYLSAVAEEA